MARSHPLRRLLIASALLLGLTSAGQFQLSNGDIVNLDPNDGGFADASPASKNQKRHDGSISPRSLFGRQYCSTPGANIICGTGCCFNYKLCCESENCFDPSFDKCCAGGGACPRTGQCCQDDKCCSAGTYCVRDLDTNQIRCRSSGVGSTPAPTTVRASISSVAVITPAPSVTRPASFSCFDAGYTACPGDKFCCPSSAYCFYNTLSQPRCYSSAYYYLTWTYSYSYSFGIRYFSTTTRYYLGGDGGVPVVTTPAPPNTPPPTSLALPTGATTSSRSTTTAAPSTGTISAGNSQLGAGATDDGGSSSASSTSSSSSSASSSASRVVSGLSGGGGPAGSGSRITLLGEEWGIWVVLGQGVAIILGVAVLA